MRLGAIKMSKSIAERYGPAAVWPPARWGWGLPEFRFFVVCTRSLLVSSLFEKLTPWIQLETSMVDAE